MQTPRGAHVTQAGKDSSPLCSGKCQLKEKQGRKAEPHSQAAEPKSEVPILGVEPVPPTPSACPWEAHLSSRPYETLTPSASTLFLEERAAVSCCCDPRLSSEKMEGAEKGTPLLKLQWER